MRIPYGFAKSETNQIIINCQQADVVKLIYNLYLQGESLGGILDTLGKRNIPSSTGNLTWTRAAIDKILSNGRYVPYIIGGEQFFRVQIEKESKSNIDDNGRKAVRYSSQNVLSGLLICGECGYNYRRIIRPSGELVWRCADRVENGKRSACRKSITVSDMEIKRAICGQMNLNSFDVGYIRNVVGTVTINKAGIVVNPINVTGTHKELSVI